MVGTDMLLSGPMDEEEKALRPIPRSYFVITFVAGAICALGLAGAAWWAEQDQPVEEAPEAAATESGVELDPALTEQLEAMDDEPGSSWLSDGE